MSPKSRTCNKKRANYREKAVASIPIDKSKWGEHCINFYTIVGPNFWNKSYRANASRKRRAENKTTTY